MAPDLSAVATALDSLLTSIKTAISDYVVAGTYSTTDLVSLGILTTLAAEIQEMVTEVTSYV